MDAALADLLVLLNLERLEVNMYRGTSRDIGSPQVFGGQVLGLAPLVLFGCIVEWSMIQLVPLWYAARGAL